MAKKQSSLEKVLQIIREVDSSNKLRKKPKKRHSRMVETDIDMFAEDEKDQ